MTIELVYRPIPRGKYKDDILRKTVRLKNNIRIEDILPCYAAIGLASWRDDSYGGMVTGDYKKSGPILNQCKYFILSENITKTIDRLKTRHD